MSAVISSTAQETTAVQVSPSRKELHAPFRFLWMDLTRKCQLSCAHCYNESGPGGTHGTMHREAWISVLDQAMALGIRKVQLIGGEPTMHPDFPALLGHALNAGLEVETYSNLVHVPIRCWNLFRRPGASLATSYYSATAEKHNAVTGRRSHQRTRANIEKAVRFGIRLRVGIVSATEHRMSTRRSES
ncbi:radical SAM protein [Streptomyces rimosus]|uniref:radical SAM protein n=1 Tax=Streptomyces rimosus TaxID=1927 RepID=UPI001F4149B3|nr:radical SAM protein [Streptomyces rimosus]